MDTLLGTNAANEKDAARLSLADRRKHVYIIGKTGQGKSVLLENMMHADLAVGRGFAFLDPHGSSAARLADSVRTSRIKDVIYFDPSDSDPPSFNPLSGAETPEEKALLAEQTVHTIHDIWPESWGPNLEYILLNAVRLALESDNPTLLDIKPILVDRAFRVKLLSRCTDDDLRAVWEDEFEERKETEWRKEIQSTLNKVGRFTSVPALRNVLGRPATLDFTDIMDHGKVLIADLSVGRIGRRPANLIGAFLVSGFASAAEKRKGKPRDFALYVDECKNFITDAFDTTLSESRKWRLSLILAHQYATQIPEHVRDAILGNVGTIIAFQSGAKSAALLAPEMDKVPKQLIELQKYQAYVKLPDHEAKVCKMSPPFQEEGGSLEAVKNNTRARYSRR